jgi:hypothetical protein
MSGIPPKSTSGKIRYFIFKYGKNLVSCGMYRIELQYNLLMNADPNPDQVFDQILVQTGQRK